jgi:hypothetical protein
MVSDVNIYPCKFNLIKKNLGIDSAIFLYCKRTNLTDQDHKTMLIKLCVVSCIYSKMWYMMQSDCWIRSSEPCFTPSGGDSRHYTKHQPVNVFYTW